MGATLIDMQSYRDLLEELLDNLRQEVVLQSRNNPAWNLDLDQYLLEINTFYYQSFQAHYLPQYESQWRREVERLLGLRQQQGVLETNIISTLKRYTSLYNLLKTLLANLAEFSRASQQEADLIQQELTRQGAELQVALISLKHQLNALLLFLQESCRYLDDQELMSFIKEYPGYHSILKGRPAVIDQQLVTLSGIIAYLIGLLDNPDNEGRAHWTRLAADMGEHITHLQKLVQNSSEPEQSWLSPSFINELLIYKAALSAAHNSPELPELIRVRLQGWHKILQVQASINPHLPGGFSPDFITDLSGLTAGDVKEAARDVGSALEQLDLSIASFDTDLEASYTVLMEVREWLSFWPAFLHSMQTEEALSRVLPLRTLLYEIQIGVRFINNQMGLIETIRHRWAYNMDRAKGLSRLAAQGLDSLGQLKDDLERLLAPRNVSRTWKDMGVRLLRVPLQKGQVFPAEHRHLLEAARVKFLAEPSQADYTIVYEEGDLFLIQVADNEQTEIPYLIISRQP